MLTVSRREVAGTSYAGQSFWIPKIVLPMLQLFTPLLLGDAGNFNELVRITSVVLQVLFQFASKCYIVDFQFFYVWTLKGIWIFWSSCFVKVRWRLKVVWTFEFLRKHATTFDRTCSNTNCSICFGMFILFHNFLGAKYYRNNCSKPALSVQVWVVGPNERPTRTSWRWVR